MTLVAADSQDRARAAWLVEELHLATAPDPRLFRSSAFDAVSLGVAVAGRDLAPPALATLAKLGAWVCGFDDLADDPSLADAELTRQIEQHLAIIAGTPVEAALEPCARLFAQIDLELRAAPGGPRLWALWIAQVGGALRAMAWERGIAASIAAGRPPELESYLAQASRSVCVELMSTAAAMLYGEPQGSGHLGALRAAQHRAALAVRLANDLATWRRERTEVGSNALALVGEGAAPILRARAADERDQLVALLEPLREPAPRTAAFTERLADFLLAVYRAGDLCVVARAA